MSAFGIVVLLSLCGMVTAKLKWSDWSDEAGWPDYCPASTPIVKCLVNPCDTHKCPEYPRAKCFPSYCGGCYAIFHDTIRGQPIDRTYDCASTAYENVSDGECGPGITVATCLVDPCKVTKCPKHPRATCESSNCGGCFARFYDTYPTTMGALSDQAYEVTGDCNNSK